MLRFEGCSVQIKAKEVYKVINNLSNAEALQRVSDERQSRDT